MVGDYKLQEHGFVHPFILEVMEGLHRFIVLRGLLTVLLHKCLILLHAVFKLVQKVFFFSASQITLLEVLDFVTLADLVLQMVLLRLWLVLTGAETQCLLQTVSSFAAQSDCFLLIHVRLGHHHVRLALRHVRIDPAAVVVRPVAGDTQHLFPLIFILKLLNLAFQDVSVGLLFDEKGTTLDVKIHEKSSHASSITYYHLETRNNL